MPQKRTRRERMRPGEAQPTRDEVAAIAKVWNRTFQIEVRETNGVPRVALRAEPSFKYFALTGMTLDELRVLRDYFNFACELAEPICKAYDEKAQLNYNEGGIDFRRLYRQVPVWVIRERPFTQYFEGLQRGSAWLAGMVKQFSSEHFRLVPAGERNSEFHLNIPVEVGAEDDEQEDHSD